MKRVVVVLASCVLALGLTSSFAQQGGDRKDRGPSTTPGPSAPPARREQGSPPATPQRQAPPTRQQGNPGSTPRRQAPPTRQQGNPGSTPRRQAPPTRQQGDPGATPRRQATPARREQGAPPTPPARQNPPPRQQGDPGPTPGRQNPPSGPQGNPGTTPQRQAPPTRQQGGPSVNPGRQNPPQRGSDPTIGPSHAGGYRDGGPRRQGDASIGQRQGPAFAARTGGMKPTNQGRTNNYFDQRFDKQPMHWNGTFPTKIKPMANTNGKNYKWQVGPINNYHWLRHGYCRPGNFWADWFFGYAYYVFDPIPWQCVFSPYYYYYCVPGYLPYRRVWCTNYRVIYIIIDPIDWRYCGNGYGYGFYSSSYGSNYDDGGNYSNLDKALSDLTDAFKYGDPTKLDRLVPRGGDVEVFIDGDYSYTVNSDEYYDITSDLIQGVHTTDFRITKVNALKNGGYFVVARHDYLDAWDNPQTNWLTFTVEESANWYAITQAGTNRSQP